LFHEIDHTLLMFQARQGDIGIGSPNLRVSV
jgi:hypothetical protein